MSIEEKLLKLMEGKYESDDVCEVGKDYHVEWDGPSHAKVIGKSADGVQFRRINTDGSVKPGVEHSIVIPHNEVSDFVEKKLHEEKKEDDSDKEDKEADQVEDAPAVTIDNPINPDLAPSADSSNPDAEPPVAEVEAPADADDKDEDEDEDKKKVEEAVATGVDAIVGSEELSEEFKLKVSTLFEAKVTEQVNLLVEEKQAKLEEEFKTKLEEAVALFENGLTEKIDGYFGNLSEQWMKDNELALEASMKSELTESFITGMKQLFESHYIDLPVEKFDIVTSLEEQLQKQSEQLSAANQLLEEQREELKKANREIILENATKGMTDIDSGKFRGMMEDFQFDDADTFTKRTEIIKESFFGNGKKESTDLSDKKLEISSTALVEETQIVSTKETLSDVAKYADFMRKNQKK